MRLLLAALLASLAAQAAADQPLGRLFLTPEKRAVLERQRQLNIQHARVIEGSSVSLAGVVARSSGRSTVWLNGAPYHDGTPAGDVRTHTSPRDARKVELQAGELRTELRVGQSVSRASGERRDPLGGGRVAVSSGAGPR